MLEALYEIGKIQKEKSPLTEMTQDFGENYKYLFNIVFNIAGSRVSYDGITVEEIDNAKQERYLYKRGESAEPAITPISIITDPEKTFTKKIVKSVASIIKKIKGLAPVEDIAFLESLDNELQLKKDDILKDFLEEFGKFGIDNKNGAVLGLAFRMDGEEKYLGDLEVFAQYLLEKGYTSNYFKYKKYSREKNKICYMCKKTSAEVWGYASTFQFYTVDKKGMVTGGFDQANAWRNYPLCPQCFSILERGRKYILKNSAFRFCGFNYLLIPKLVLVNDEALKDVLSRLKKYKAFTLEKDKGLYNVDVEERIFNYLQDNENYANFDFLFFKEERSGSVFNILLYLENITPTRLAAIVNAKADVDNDENRKYKIFTDIPFTNKEGERKIYNILFSFHNVRKFFPYKKDKENNEDQIDFDNYFLDIVKNIFFLKPIAMGFLLNRFMEKIRSDFLNEKSVFYTTLSAFKILVFLDKLNILNRRRYEYMESDGRYEDFFTEHRSFFDDDSKKALFLEGVLVQKLLDTQQREQWNRGERGKLPFRSRLNGLKIDEKIARRLLTETINKLEEYDKNFYRKLEAEISRYFLNSDLKKFSTEELSFYFVMGMNLAGNFEKKENKVDKEENNE